MYQTHGLLLHNVLSEKEERIQRKISKEPQHSLNNVKFRSKVHILKALSINWLKWHSILCFKQTLQEDPKLSGLSSAFLTQLVLTSHQSPTLGASPHPFFATLKLPRLMLERQKVCQLGHTTGSLYCWVVETLSFDEKQPLISMVSPFSQPQMSSLDTLCHSYLCWAAKSSNVCNIRIRV